MANSRLTVRVDPLTQKQMLFDGDACPLHDCDLHACGHGGEGWQLPDSGLRVSMHAMWNEIWPKSKLTGRLTPYPGSKSEPPVIPPSPPPCPRPPPHLCPKPAHAQSIYSACGGSVLEKDRKSSHSRISDQHI